MRWALPVDGITHLYLLAITVLILLGAPEKGWPHLLWPAVAGITLIAIQAATRGRTDPVRAVARLFYLMVFLPLSYLQLKHIIPAVHPRSADAALRAADRAIFGTDPTVALQSWIHPVATEVLQVAYITYYILPLVVPIWLLVRRRTRETERFALALMVCYALNYLGYIAVPAVGPIATIPHETDLGGLLLARPIHDWILEVDAARYDCFPSGHTAISILVAVSAWRVRLRRLAVVLTIDGALIVMATVYLRYHYVVDLPAGAILALGSLALSEWVYRSTS